ncbi:P4 alpha zinc-binding domain protein [Paraburkholderia hospita]|uniref:P4 alpha zinc-binding domain protein n=1 Tax=Paraburkholderia hospita TaxID=169430 RepID=A0ABN0FMQ5_9BURK|nr:primase-helicase zinc-binding domain-containing protein [Paraburkholderia hospita]EIN00057.1 P4 alpha zinc-binding domain protein [Paraburkholderia hospita]OUL87820.1 zinc-binding protein [Paraburkholderia hospita]
MNVKDVKLSPEQWVALLQKYGVPASSLTGKGSPCPICGGNDRFTYDNKRDRGDWVCRKCNDGNFKAGDGFELICKSAGITFRELMLELDGGLPVAMRTEAVSRAAPGPGRKADPAWAQKRLDSMWESAIVNGRDDPVSRYLRSRVPGLAVAPSSALRLAMLEYRHEKKVIGQWPGILARFTLPDGRLGTLHRTFLDRSKPAKATIITDDGEVLPSKMNDVTLNKLNGGAVRLMEPINGEIGVGEGLETVLAAHMMFGVPVWYCLNRILLSDFVVPEGLGIRVVHIFADFDVIDPKTRKSPGMDAALTLAKRLRVEGYTAVIRRPKVRGTDFADEWLATCASPRGGAVPQSASRVLQALHV